MRLPTRAAAPGWFAALAFFCTLSIAFALTAQHGFDLQPCPWCILQRLIVAAIGLAALAAALVRASAMRVVAAGLIVLLAIGGAAAALWQHFVASSSTSCDLTLADRIVSATGLDLLVPQVFAPFATCADAAVRVAGVPFEFFSLALFVLSGVLAVLLLRVRG